MRAVPLLTVRRSLGALAVALLALPVLWVSVLSTNVADSIGSQLAFGLATVLAPLAAQSELERALDAAIAPSWLSEPGRSDAAAEPRRVAGSAGTQGKGVRHSRIARPSHSIRVSAQQVLALARRRALPSAAPVRATAEHPAGLRLSGVSALGVGLQDGDVLTEAAGQRVAALPTVVAIVLAARSRRSPEISGHFYRAGVPYTVTVEQPYPAGS